PRAGLAGGVIALRPLRAELSLRKLPAMPDSEPVVWSQRISPDGTKMAVVHIAPPAWAVNIAVYDFASQRTTFVTQFKNMEQRATPEAPIWSPDGTALVF